MRRSYEKGGSERQGWWRRGKEIHTLRALPTMSGLVPTARCTTQGPCVSRGCTGEQNTLIAKLIGKTARFIFMRVGHTTAHQGDVRYEFEAGVSKLVVSVNKASKQRILLSKEKER